MRVGAVHVIGVQVAESQRGCRASGEVASRWIQMFDQENRPMTEAPRATAGLKAPPLMRPTAVAPTAAISSGARACIRR